MKRHALQMLRIEHDLERVVAGPLEGDAGKSEDDMGLEWTSRCAVGDFERPFGLEQLTAVRIHQANDQPVIALLGEIGPHPEDENHGGVAEGKLASPNRVEDAQDVELAFLAHVRGVGDDGEIDLHGFGCPES